MNDDKYIGMDVHQASTVIAVHNGAGKTIVEAIIETKVSARRDFFKGLSGTIHVRLEEGTQAGWLYEVIRPLVREVMVCDPRRNKLIQTGTKGDRVDAHKLARLLRLGELRAVYQGEVRSRALKELLHNYNCVVGDTTQVMNRIKAIYRGRGIGCAGGGVYRPDQRQPWLAQLPGPAVRQRAQTLYQQLDCLQQLKQQAGKSMLAQARRDAAYGRRLSIPGLGAIRVSQIMAVVGSPHRFRTKRQLWPYAGLAVVTKSRDEYQLVNGRVERKKKPVQTRGLNRNYNRTLKVVFKGAALQAIQDEPFQSYDQRLLGQGMRAEMARLTVARKIAAITLAVWKQGAEFDPEKVTPTA